MPDSLPLVVIKVLSMERFGCLAGNETNPRQRRDICMSTPARKKISVLSDENFSADEIDEIR